MNFFSVMLLLFSAFFFLLQQSHSQIRSSGNFPGNIKTVFVILMENKNWSNIQGNASAPYINGLLSSHDGSYATQYFNPSGLHPSEPNYVWLEAATNSFSDHTFTTDADPSSSNATRSTNHLTALLNAKGLSWKAYIEDILGSDCPLVSGGNYAAKHVPFVFFRDITQNNSTSASTCISHIRPYTEFASDVSSNNVGSYNFITPNLCNDMHDCSVQTGDTWLSHEIPKIMASSAYKNGGAIFITWDEAASGDGPIGMVVLSPFAKGNGYHNAIHYDHSSFVRTVEEIFGITPILANAQSATDLSDLFSSSAGSTGSPPPAGSPTTSLPSGSPSPTSISLTLCPHGIANCGDNANPQSTGNMNPVHTQRSVIVEISDINNTPVTIGQGTVSLDSSSGTFKGTVNVGSISSGQYIVKVTMPQYLTKQIGVIQQITGGQTPSTSSGSSTNTTPEVFLITGDINGDNKLDILDYNILVNCFGSKFTTASCTAPATSQTPGADLIDDGKVDGVDYNLFLRELSVQNGQ